MKTPILILAACLAPVVSSCREKGPAEKTGEKLDEAGENIKDAVDPRGPAEKVGDKIDKATGN